MQYRDLSAPSCLAVTELLNMYTPKTFICFCTSVRCHIYAKRSPIANFPCQSEAAARSFQSLSPVIRGHMFPRRDGLLARWCQCPSVTPFTFLAFSPPIRLSVCLWGTRGASQSAERCTQTHMRAHHTRRQEKPWGYESVTRLSRIHPYICCIFRSASGWAWASVTTMRQSPPAQPHSTRMMSPCIFPWF